MERENRFKGFFSGEYKKQENACKKDWIPARSMVQWNYLYERLEVMGMMSVITGILVCAFVFVIREAIAAPGEEDYDC